MGIQHGHLHKIDPDDLLKIKDILKNSITQMHKGTKIQHDISAKTLKNLKGGTSLKHTIDPQSLKKGLNEIEGFLGKQKADAAKAIAIGSLIAGAGAASGSKLVGSVFREKKAFWDGFEKSAKELTSKARESLPDAAFVFPEKRKYPIHDKAHARNALARVAQFGSPSEQKEVQSAVHAKFPSIRG